MFEMSGRVPSILTENEDEGYDHNRHLNINHMISQKANTINQRIFLPRGSGQSRFQPQPYYYLASKSGAVPSWVIDETLQNGNRNHH
jgi:hypothetical protein